MPLGKTVMNISPKAETGNGPVENGGIQALLTSVLMQING